MTSVGLINPFEKFRKVLIIFFLLNFLNYVQMLLLWSPLSKICRDSQIGGALVRAFFPHWGPNLVQLWMLPNGL